MRSLIFILAVMSAGCSMTPAQQRWTAIGVGVVATGLILAHEADQGRGALAPTASSSDKGRFSPCPSGDSRNCK